MTISTLIVLYLLFVVPLVVRSLLLTGAALYRAGQSNSAPPKLFEMPTLPRFNVGRSSNGKAERHESERLPEV